MIDFVGTSPSLKKTLWVTMTPMHFHIAQTDLFMRIFLSRNNGVPGDILAPIQNCPWGARYVKLDPGVVGLTPKSVHDVCSCFQLIYSGFIKILEYANEVISYTTTR